MIPSTRNLAAAVMILMIPAGAIADDGLQSGESIYRAACPAVEGRFPRLCFGLAEPLFRFASLLAVRDTAPFFEPVCLEFFLRRLLEFPEGLR